MDRESTDQKSLKRYISQQPRYRSYPDSDPNKQTVKLYTYLHLKTENLNDWQFNKELLLIFYGVIIV